MTHTLPSVGGGGGGSTPAAPQLLKAPVQYVFTEWVDLGAPGESGLTGVNLENFPPGMRLLVTENADPENGIYVWDSTTTPMVRAADANTTELLPDGTLVVDANNVFTWVLLRQNSSETEPWVLDTENSGVRVYQLPEYYGGTGIEVNGTQIAVSLNQNAGARGIANNGGLCADWTYVPSKRAFTIGNGSQTDFQLNHGFPTRDVIVQLYSLESPYDAVTAGYQVQRELDRWVRIVFDVAPASDSVRVVIYGSALSPFDE